MLADPDPSQANAGSRLAKLANMPIVELAEGVVPFPGCLLSLPLTDSSTRLAIATAVACGDNRIVLLATSNIGVIAEVKTISTQGPEALCQPVCRIRPSTGQAVPELIVETNDPGVLEITRLAEEFLSQDSLISNRLEIGNSPEVLLDAVACFGHLPTAVRLTVLEADTWDTRAEALLPYLRQFQALDAAKRAHRKRRAGTAAEIDCAAIAADISGRMQAAGIAGETLDQAQRRLETLATRANERDSGAASLLEYARSLPWERRSALELDVHEARRILNSEHLGSDALKARILEELLVRECMRQRGGQMRGTILCFAGEPGTGKTSLAQLMARVMNRPFARIALGGVSEAHSLLGTPIQYKRSSPGRILDAIRTSGSFAPVILLDELDKLGGMGGENGDPAFALLSVLDPEQQRSWKDACLDLPTPLDQVVFIATVNSLAAVPEPLRDRLEIIELPAYSITDRFEIGKHVLLGRALAAYETSTREIMVTDDALRGLVAMSDEPGVRQLQRNIEAVVRKALVYLLDHAAPVVVDERLTREWVTVGYGTRIPIGFQTVAQVAAERALLD